MSRKLKQLEEKMIQIRAQIASEKARETQQLRKQDTRRKILVGAYFIDKYTKDDKYDELKKMIAPFLTRESDKSLFGIKTTDKI